jgi:hypothetical protein
MTADRKILARFRDIKTLPDDVPTMTAGGGSAATVKVFTIRGAADG